jgi:hypothetical protein
MPEKPLMIGLAALKIRRRCQVIFKERVNKTALAYEISIKPSLISGQKQHRAFGQFEFLRWVILSVHLV